ncbi:YigZ family protein [Flagellimonas sp. DF-77]
MELKLKTLTEACEPVLLKERKSKFYGYAFPIQNEEDAKHLVAQLRKEHPLANHVCHAWKIGLTQPMYRASDDGEPNNSAGKPIYGQIQAFEVTNVLVAVVRIFGGVKLGVGGLIQAYKAAAQMALASCELVIVDPSYRFRLKFTYVFMDRIMRVIKQQNLEIQEQDLALDCTLIVGCPQSKIERVEEAFAQIRELEWLRLE